MCPAPDTDRRRVNRRSRGGRRHADAPRTPSRLVLIEPHDDTRVLYTTVFEEAGYAVYPVGNGSDAIAVTLQRLPDVVVMEMVGPEMDGCAILERLRPDAATADIPAVVVTSWLHFDLPERARQSGATLVLAKPVLPDALLTAVDDVLDSTPLERVVRRQLHRPLRTLQKLGSTLDDDAKLRVRKLIDRLQIAVLALDDDGRCVAASLGAQTLTGYQREDLLRMSVFDARLGSDLPLARGWDEFRRQKLHNSETTIRDRQGRPVHVHTAFATILPDLHAAALGAL
jgi:PAS domain S-box-containing protein